MTRAELLDRLRALKPWLEERGVARVRVFGSHARDQARADSDVDLLVDLSRPLGLDFFGVQDELASRLGATVEMFTDAEIPRDIRRSVLADAIEP